MRGYTLGHLSDAVLIRDLKSLLARDRETTAMLLAHIAEVDARKLYAPAGYSSMFAYCVQELHFSEDAAYKRIQAARAGRRFPQLLEAVVEGRIHLTGAGLLAPHLTESNVERFIVAATHRGKSEIEGWLAAHSTSRALARASESSIRPIPQLAPAQVRDADVPIPFDGAVEQAPGNAHLAGGGSGDASGGEAAAPGSQLAPAQVHPEAPSVPTPSISGPRFLVQFTIDEETHDRLRHVQALLSHAVPMNDVGELFRRALESLAAEVEKRKLGSVSRRTPIRRSTPKRARDAAKRRPSYTSARVRRAVWERDRGQCTFVSAGGHRCGERRFLEFDHVDPIARGGRSTIQGLRLRCRAHNQLEAERVFGAGFMSQKREEARAVRKTNERANDIMEGLRSLGCRGPDARRAAEHAMMFGDATLEDQMRVALSFVTRRSRASIPRRPEEFPARVKSAIAEIQPQPPYGVHTNLAPS